MSKSVSEPKTFVDANATSTHKTFLGYAIRRILLRKVLINFRIFFIVVTDWFSLFQFHKAGQVFYWRWRFDIDVDTGKVFVRTVFISMKTALSLTVGSSLRPHHHLTMTPILLVGNTAKIGVSSSSASLSNITRVMLRCCWGFCNMYIQTKEGWFIRFCVGLLYVLLDVGEKSQIVCKDQASRWPMRIVMAISRILVSPL